MQQVGTKSQRGKAVSRGRAAAPRRQRAVRRRRDAKRRIDVRGTPLRFFLLRFVAPRGENRGKVVVGLRVIKTTGTAVRTGGMLIRGHLGIVCNLIALYLDNFWIL